MFDSHIAPVNWGVHPLIVIGNIKIPSYSLMILMGLVAAFLFYKYDTRGFESDKKTNTYLIGVFAITSGAIGAKLPTWLSIYLYSENAGVNNYLFSSGRTIVGGLIGGFVGVKLAKKIMGIKDKRGNELAPAIAIGMVFGRMGCFLAGCCYGVETHMPWAVDFGDGLLRHPTQVYEIVFHLLAVVLLIRGRKKNPAPGAQLKQYFVAYLTFRFIIEFIRVNPIVWMGLSGYQIACLAFVPVLLYKLKVGATVEG